MSKQIAPSASQIEIFVAPSGALTLNVLVDGETAWLTQRQMAELFETSTDNVGLHLKNVSVEGELI